MYAYGFLSVDQVDKMKAKHSVYVAPDGRISLPSLHGVMGKVTDAIADVMK